MLVSRSVSRRVGGHLDREISVESFASFSGGFDDAKTVPNSGMVIPLRLADRLGVVDGLDRRVGEPTVGRIPTAVSRR